MSASAKDHWESVYVQKGPQRVSWFRPHLDRSLAFLDLAKLGPDAAIIDVGGGASTFVDDLLGRGQRNVTVLDLSAAALESAKARLGERAAQVRWICADILEAKLPERAYDFWHDRAVFHFLTSAEARARYVESVKRSLQPGGHVVVATFGPHGPEKCSGLEVVRFSAEGIHAEFGDDFVKVGDTTEIHNTPWGSDQEFVYCYCRVPG